MRNVPRRVRVRLSRKRNEDEDAKVQGMGWGMVRRLWVALVLGAWCFFFSCFLVCFVAVVFLQGEGRLR